ncbi:Ig-like domain-containing protein [Phenylobacterium deserti]|uniref:SbsA Ig-like domain-containing protein n=1 Tax=Phenylobacterium deserti TaxID=1914756 RepID=A0A328ARR5_9CAUL|nr:Ig-like domain-containing protein [Phenylobacterium deserti]RAK56416.1 hypothetical protein DJ018_00035 [Phenylobacterium deserti]
MIVRMTALIALVPAVAFAEPELVSSWPKDGAKDVQPGEQTLVFVFSEAMARDRMSVTVGDLGVAPDFVGPPEFSDDGRTFRIRMRLKPGLTYVVGANGPNHTNFRSLSGEPARPAAIRFTTAAAAPKTPL